MTFAVESFQFSGLRNDKGKKFVPENYFFDIENFNYDDVTGCSRIKCPSVKYNSGSASPDGIFEFRYVNSSGVFTTETILVINGSVIKDFLGTPVTIYTGLTAGKKCTFAIMNDQLFISNGTDYPIAYNGTYVKQMGAPYAQDNAVGGTLSGAYKYAMSFVVNGVELITGTISNTLTVTNKKIVLSLPVGIATCTERKIYRTTAGGSTLKLLATVSDNHTTAYTDQISDGSLGATIAVTNAGCPKPQFITVKNEKLIGCVDVDRPNYLYVTEFEVETFFKTFGVSDVTGIGNDNTKISGMIQDYNQLIIFSESHIYLADTSGLATAVQQTNSNVGCLDGFSIARIPENDVLTGGIMFVSNLYDVRVFSGAMAQNLATSFDNLKTNNFSSQINKEQFKTELSAAPLHAAFYDYKYHLITDSYIYVFDIRVSGWTKYSIKTTTHTPKYNIFGQFNKKLYIGQKTAGIVEEMYVDTKYRNEDITAFFETPELAVGTSNKHYRELYLFYDKSGSNTFDILATINSTGTKRATVSYIGGVYDSDIYDSDYYLTSDDDEDYKVMHIDRYGRWMRFKLTTTTSVIFRGYKLDGRALSNKEL
jgi:hypothetical protein